MQTLRSLIIKDIQKKGKITFAEFMHMALYHPHHGYYNSDSERIGKSGDYYTSPTVHSIFGQLIAKQLEEMWNTMGKEVFTIVEMGANKGWLCYDIVHCIQKEYPEFYEKFYYIIVESNPYMRKKQRILLKSVDMAEDKVSWHSYSENGFSFDSVQGCFLSNEFVDALPVHRIKVKKGVLKEIYVGYNNGNFFETEDGISNTHLKNFFTTYQIPMEEDREYEINLTALEWLRHVSEILQRGFIITVDYGDISDGLYREDSATQGTLRCLYKHTVNRDFYEQAGEQDITAHVNFSHLMQAGKSFGLGVTGFTKQSHFLLALGILERLNNNIDAILKGKNLIHPEGMGEIFKVLIQHKNIKNPQLTGLSPLESIEM